MQIMGKEIVSWAKVRAWKIVCACVCAHFYVCVHEHECMCVHACLCVTVWVWMHVCGCMWMCVCVGQHSVGRECFGILIQRGEATCVVWALRPHRRTWIDEDGGDGVPRKVGCRAMVEAEPDFPGQLDIWGSRSARCEGWPGRQGMGPWPLAQDAVSIQEGTGLWVVRFDQLCISSNEAKQELVVYLRPTILPSADKSIDRPSTLQILELGPKWKGHIQLYDYQGGCKALESTSGPRCPKWGPRARNLYQEDMITLLWYWEGLFQKFPHGDHYRHQPQEKKACERHIQRWE